MGTIDGDGMQNEKADMAAQAVAQAAEAQAAELQAAQAAGNSLLTRLDNLAQVTNEGGVLSVDYNGILNAA